MSRPKPTILAEYINKAEFKVEQILEADAIWAIFYKDKPINMKSDNIANPDASPKYRKVSFSNKGHAINLVEQLNKMFECSDFSVYKLVAGEKVY